MGARIAARSRRLNLFEPELDRGGTLPGQEIERGLSWLQTVFWPALFPLLEMSSRRQSLLSKWKKTPIFNRSGTLVLWSCLLIGDTGTEMLKKSVVELNFCSN